MNDSVEDFILKLDDLGFSDGKDLTNLLHTSVDEKIKIAIDLVKSMAAEKERVLIEDKGAIVQYSGEFVDWFQDIVDSLIDSEHLSFCISSKFRPNKNISHKKPVYYIEEIPELDKSERNGLLTRYAKFKNLELERDDLSFFSDLLTGYPEQIIYAVDMIEESSIFEAKKNSHLIQEYATDKARLIIDSLKDDEKSLNFLYFLSRFEFISFEFLFDVVEEDDYFPILSSFLLSSICERLGSTGDYIFSIQEALTTGVDVPDKLLIPSYFLKTIKSLYDKGGSANYKEVIRLSDRVLLNEAYLHSNIVNHVCFLKCQALARLRDPDFFGAVKKIRQPESSFLHGFYYRISGNQEKSIENYMRVLRNKPNDLRTKSELVLVYMQSDEHNLAFDLAKEVYDRNPNNPLNANNYLSCIFHKDKADIDRKLVEEIASRLQSDPSDRAQEMYCSARAKILANLDNNIDAAYEIIEESIKKYPDVTYPALTLADLSIHNKNLYKLKHAIEILDKSESKNTQTYRTYIRYKSIYLALNGQNTEAFSLARKELKGVRKEAMDAFFERLSSL